MQVSESIQKRQKGDLIVPFSHNSYIFLGDFWFLLLFMFWFGFWGFGVLFVLCLFWGFCGLFFLFALVFCWYFLVGKLFGWLDGFLGSFQVYLWGIFLFVFCCNE